MMNNVRVCVLKAQQVVLRLRVRGPAGPWRIADCRMPHLSLRGALWEACEWAKALDVGRGGIWVGRKCLLDHPELLRTDRQLRLGEAKGVDILALAGSADEAAFREQMAENLEVRDATD